MTISKIHFTFLTVASGYLCFVMSLCMPYEGIVSLCVFACNSTYVLSYTEDMFNAELQIDSHCLPCNIHNSTLE